MDHHDRRIGPELEPRVGDAPAEIDLLGVHEEELVEPAELSPEIAAHQHERAGNHGDGLRLRCADGQGAATRARQADRREDHSADIEHRLVRPEVGRLVWKHASPAARARTRMRVGKADEPRDLIASRDRVGIEQHDVLARRVLGEMVVAAAEAEIAREIQHAHAGKALAHELRAAVVRAIDEEDLRREITDGTQRAADAGLEVRAIAVADDEHARARRIGARIRELA